MSRIGFIGLGIMGAPMASNLVRAGHQVTAHDHKQSAMDRIATLGDRAAPTVAAAVEGAEIVLTMLPDWPQVEEVSQGPFGIFETVKAAGPAGLLHQHDGLGDQRVRAADGLEHLERSGVDARAGLDMLAGGLAASRILDTKRETMLTREFKPGFRIDLHHKDMGIAIAAARDAGVSLPMTGLVAQLIAAARAQGYGSLDHSALLKVTEALSGAGPDAA